MSNETLVTETTATTPEGESASQTTEQQAATGADTAGQQQQQEGQPAAEAQPETKPDEAKAKEEPEGSPEQYEFKPTEGLDIDPAVIGSFAEVAKELNLPQDAAQKMLDKMAPVLATRQAEQLDAAREHWANEARSDKEFGGEHLAENLSHAKKALDAFATPELHTLLNDSGLGNHPEVIRFMVRAGKAISEDGFVRGNGGKSNTHDPKRLYPNSNMN